MQVCGGVPARDARGAASQAGRELWRHGADEQDGQGRVHERHAGEWVVRPPDYAPACLCAALLPWPPAGVPACLPAWHAWHQAGLQELLRCARVPGCAAGSAWIVLCAAPCSV